ncbi:Lrp/AsnC family transcriptional regulator [Paracoccaceae bacterium GXU_MW_L88]
MTELDRTDRRLIHALQGDATLTNAELGERLNLSASQAGRRRQKLEEGAIITGARALVDAPKVGLTIESFVQVVMAGHSRRNAKDFETAMQRRPEIVAVWTLTGEADYLLRVYTPDLKALNHLVQEVLLDNPAVARVQSQIVMDRVKPDAPLPLDGD